MTALVLAGARPQPPAGSKVYTVDLKHQSAIDVLLAFTNGDAANRIDTHAPMLLSLATAAELTGEDVTKIMALADEVADHFLTVAKEVAKAAMGTQTLKPFLTGYMKDKFIPEFAHIAPAPVWPTYIDKILSLLLVMRLFVALPTPSPFDALVPPHTVPPVAPADPDSDAGGNRPKRGADDPADALLAQTLASLVAELADVKKTLAAGARQADTTPAGGAAGGVGVGPDGDGLGTRLLGLLEAEGAVCGGRPVNRLARDACPSIAQGPDRSLFPCPQLEPPAVSPPQNVS
eukprot:gene7754-7206_t